jgi:hypothetical protein
MPDTADSLAGIDEATAHVDRAREALGQVPKRGGQTVAVDGLQHELRALAERLRALRDDVAGEMDRGA